jgi:chromosome segregation ATPase
MKPRFQLVPSGPSYYINVYGVSVKKTMKKSIILLATAMLLASAASLTLVYAQDDPAVVAEGLLDSVNLTSTEVNNLFDSFIEGNGTVPENASIALDEANTLYAEAQTAFKAGEYEEAIDKATEALNKYGDASELLIEVDEDGEEEDEDEEEDTYYKLGGYERALDRLDKLRELVADLGDQGVDVSNATALMDQAESILGDIGAAIDLGNFEGLEEMLDEANSLMGQATGLLQRNSSQKRVEKTEHFIAQTRHHFEQLETKLYRIMAKYNISGEDEEAIQLQFQALQDALDALEGDVDKDDLKNMTRRLQHVVKESNEIGKDKDIDKKLIEKANEASRKESKLNRYRERLQVLADQGYNTTQIEELLDQAQELLNEATESLDEETADELIDEADDLIDEADELIDDLEKGNKNRGKNGKDDDEADDEEDILEKVEELRNKINEYRQELVNQSSTEVNRTELEARLDDLEEALDGAETEEEVESIEEELDEIGDLIDDTQDDDRGHSENGRNNGRDDDEPEEEEPEPEEEEEPEDEPEEETG